MLWRHARVQSKSVTGGGNVAPTCMAFSEGEVNEFFVGSEEATVYQAYRHGTYVFPISRHYQRHDKCGWLMVGW